MSTIDVFALCVAAFVLGGGVAVMLVTLGEVLERARRK